MPKANFKVQLCEVKRVDLALVNYQYEKNAHEDGNHIHEEVEGVLDGIGITHLGSFDDHLRIQHHISNKHQQTSIKLCHKPHPTHLTMVNVVLEPKAV